MELKTEIETEDGDSKLHAAIVTTALVYGGYRLARAATKVPFRVQIRVKRRHRRNPRKMVK